MAKKIYLCVATIALIVSFIITKAKLNDDHTLTTDVRTQSIPRLALAKEENIKISNKGKEHNQRITALEALNRIEKYNETNKNIGDRAKYAADMVTLLCMNGQIEEAWQIIEPDYGSVRSSQIFAFFKNGNFDIEQVLLYSRRFTDSADTFNGVYAYLRSKNLDGLLQLRSNSGFAELESFLQKKQQANNNLSYLVAGALRCASEPISDIQRLDSAKTLYRDKVLDIKELVTFIQPTIQENAFDAYDFLKTNAVSDLQTQAGKTILRETISRMIEIDADKSIKTLIDDAKGDASREVAIGFEMWSAQDSRDSYDWFIANQLKLSEPQRSSVAMGFFKSAINAGEIEGAVKWNAYITDPRLRNTTDQVLKLKLKK
jgi:hypothetical protein